MSSSPSFLWYDLETWGRSALKSRIAQFAAIRSDEALNIIDEPISLFCQPADDLLPSPGACMITGLTPQQVRKIGVTEAHFIANVHEQMMQPQTCSVGYNSLRFDDEFIRFGLYRNFYDPYEREWRGGNSRWDLIDVLRLAHALRPGGIEWPKKDDGIISFKLEELAQANHLRIGDAHEALSDVRALIGLAKKFKASQPKLWDYALQLRDKKYVMSLLNTVTKKPLLHISSRYSAAKFCAALVMPIVRHPQIDSRVIVFDLDADPSILDGLDSNDIADRLYTSNKDLPEGEVRIPLKEVHANRCPILVPLHHLRDADWQRLKIDRDTCLAHAETLKENIDLEELIRQVYRRNDQREPADADAALYDGFIADADRRLFSKLRSSDPAQLSEFTERFTDPRCRELVFRYQARNWPDSLTGQQLERWNDYRRARFADGSEFSEYSFDTYFNEIAALRGDPNLSIDKIPILDALQVWGLELQHSLH